MKSAAGVRLRLEAFVALSEVGSSAARDERNNVNEAAIDSPLWAEAKVFVGTPTNAEESAGLVDIAGESIRDWLISAEKGKDCC